MSLQSFQNALRERNIEHLNGEPLTSSIRSKVQDHLIQKRFTTNCEIALRFHDVNPSRTIDRLRKQGEQIYTYWLRDWEDNWYVKYYRPRIELRKDRGQKIRGTYRPKG